MPYATTAKNTMLDALEPDTIGLHSGHPGGDGLSNEIAGGSPAYARKAATISAASGGTRVLASAVAFDVPAGASVAWHSIWDASVFLGSVPNVPNGSTPQAAYGEATSDTINLDGHGLSNGDRFVVYPLVDALPGGLSETIIYHVVGADADSFQGALTNGGAAVDITADGDLVIQEVVVEAYTLQGVHTVNALVLP